MPQELPQPERQLQVPAGLNVLRQESAQAAGDIYKSWGLQKTEPGLISEILGQTHRSEVCLSSPNSDLRPMARRDTTPSALAQ